MCSLKAILLLTILSLCLGVTLAGCGDDDDDPSAGSGQATDGDDDADDDDADDDATDDDDDDDDDDDNDDTPEPETTEGYEYVPAGSFNMGSPENELGHRENEPRRLVTLTRHFEMKATEVSQSEFEGLMGHNPSHFPYFSEDLARPVEKVSFFDALAFANETSETMGMTPCYSLADIVCADQTPGDAIDYCKANGGIVEAQIALAADSVYDCEGFRLPTEAEWEHAARAGTATATYNGEVTNPSCKPLDETLDSIAWYCGNADGQTRPVGTKEPNDLDLYDMLGNVKEWTWDLYAHDNTNQATDPEGAADGRYRVVKGGAARFHGAAHSRAAFRTGHTPGEQLMTLGFRLARTLPNTPDASKWVKALPLSESRGEESQKDWPDELPFVFTRPATGTPLTPSEITEFTERITSFWLATDHFHWYRWISHGMNDAVPGRPAYKLFPQVSSGAKSGNIVELRHTGPSDNLWIPTGKIFNAFAALYLATGDANAAYMIEQYCQGFVALFKGFVWSEDDPEPWILPRTIFPENHSYSEEGRDVTVNYDPIKQYDYDWNGWTIPNAENPYFDTLWVRTHRSKDDVPHIYRIVPHLYRLIEQASDQTVVDAAEEALKYMEQWNRDIVDSGYYIRTKDEEGDTYIPMNDNSPFLVNDLASYVCYDPLIPDAECDPELAAAFIAYGEPLGNDCGNGRSLVYDFIASYQHYFNDRNIIRIFHIDAVIFALLYGYDDMAEELLEGLAERTDDVFDNSRQADERSYDADTASYLLAAATAGLPLTDRETRHIVQEYDLAMTHYLTWPNWDLWDPSVPDGEVEIQPSDVYSSSKAVVRLTEMAYFIEYCASPFKNEAGAEVVDCNVILDPALWGGAKQKPIQGP